MPTQPVRLVKTGRHMALSVDRWQVMYEGAAPSVGDLRVTVQVLALDGLEPAAGLVRVRNLTQSTQTADEPVNGLEAHLNLPDLPAVTGDTFVIEARPVASGHQVFIQFGSAVVSTVDLGDAPYPPAYTTPNPYGS